MEVEVNTAYLHAQSQQKLQLDYKTNITQNSQKIELYESPTTKGLKKSHSSRQVGGAEMKTRRDVQRHGDAEQVAPPPRVVDKNREGNLRSEGSQPHIRPLSLGFQHQEDKFP